MALRTAQSDPGLAPEARIAGEIGFDISWQGARRSRGSSWPTTTSTRVTPAGAGPPLPSASVRTCCSSPASSPLGGRRGRVVGARAVDAKSESEQQEQGERAGTRGTHESGQGNESIPPAHRVKRQQHREAPNWRCFAGLFALMLADR
jgi:hypothetical protein